MAYALVGSVGTASATPAYAQATSAGNLLICWVRASGATSSTSTGWAQAVEKISGAGSTTASIWYRANSTAGEAAPTITNLIVGALAEFSGGATSLPLDQIGSQNGLATPILAVAAAADTAAGQLVVTTGQWVLSKSATNTTADTYNNGATPTSNLNNDATSTSGHYRFAWGTTTGKTAADQDSQSNDSMNLSSGCLVIASFKLASAARFPRNPAIDFIDPAFV